MRIKVINNKTGKVVCTYVSDIIPREGETIVFPPAVSSFMLWKVKRVSHETLIGPDKVHRQISVTLWATSNTKD